MWSSLLGLAFLLAFEPVRIGVVLLLISRPRPVQNLFALWIAAFSVGVLSLLVPLVVLHGAPQLDSFAEGLPTNSTVRHFQIGMGAFALLMAVFITVRSLMRTRKRAEPLPPGNETMSTVPDSPRPRGRHRAAASSYPPTALSGILERAQDAATENKSPVGRLIGRVRRAWDNGSSWVAFLIGLGPLPIETLVYVMAIIAPSGAGLGTQMLASVVFIVVMLAVIEIALVSYLVMPTKTQAVLQVLHDWLRARRTQVLIAMLGVGGLALVASGLGVGIGSI
ncbi:GAP family protein [Mycolicibacterium sp. GF69]|uniref:GAP family protein n=1 Tax=Mycolicibacterium sp. GF69 TaxID=2267251 RepID=UPI001403C486|nr:GAP family protein [Mycolicibacterium sp. GF69]